jgi:hypothetical protein
VQGGGSQLESARGVSDGSPQNRQVTWLSHKKTEGFAGEDGFRPFLKFILQYFVMHTLHGVKVYQVSFQTLLVLRHLDFPSWSYDKIIEDHLKAQKTCEN